MDKIIKRISRGITGTRLAVTALLLFALPAAAVPLLYDVRYNPLLTGETEIEFIFDEDLYTDPSIQVFNEPARIELYFDNSDYEEKLEQVIIDHQGEEKTLNVDELIVLFGLTPKLGAIAHWGLEIEKNAIKVNNALDYQTNIEGIYAIGDVNIYPGKLKLILCGFHEATLMCQSVYNRINPGKRYVLKYTTVSGVDGFDGTRKEAEKAVVKSID